VTTDGSAQRLRVGAELRRLREMAQLSGEYVARSLGWSQPKVSRIEAGRTAFTVKDVAGLLALYGVADDVRAELLGSTAEDTGEGAWTVRAGDFPHRPDATASGESVTRRVRHHQTVVLPGLLQTYDYAVAVAKAAGAADPHGIAATRMRRREALTAKGAPRHEVVLDARALLLPVADMALVRRQILDLVDTAASVRRLDLRIIPLGAVSPVFSVAGFTVYDFRAVESPPVAWIESPTGDLYFSASEDISRYAELFTALQGAALTADRSVEYLCAFAMDVERYLDPLKSARPQAGGR